MKALPLILGVLLGCQALLAADSTQVSTALIVKQDLKGSTAEIQLLSPSGEPIKSPTRKIKFSSGDNNIAWEGRRARFETNPTIDPDLALRMFPAELEALRQIAEITDALHRETLDKGRLVTRMPSELVPNMALWDQTAKLVTKKDMLGAPLAINFIFTSCRNARMCPASTQAMKNLADELDKDASLAAVRLLSITFDPENDSPGVLKAYADGYQINPQRHRFLTGDSSQIKDLMKHYGILTVRDDGTIVHNAALIIVSAEGRIVRRKEGAVFDPVEVAQIFAQLQAPAHK
jgi:protein SCO1/2